MTELIPTKKIDNGRYILPLGETTEIVLRAGRGTTLTNILHKSPGTSRKSLGMLTCPKGNWDEEAERLRLKSNIHAVWTMSNRFRRSDATQAHPSIWSALMTYSLPVTGMTTKQLENIQKKVRRASLRNVGFNQNFPLAVVYGSNLTGGIEMVDLTMEKGTRAVEHFLYHK